MKSAKRITNVTKPTDTFLRPARDGNTGAYLAAPDLRIRSNRIRENKWCDDVGAATSQPGPVTRHLGSGLAIDSCDGAIGIISEPRSPA